MATMEDILRVLMILRHVLIVRKEVIGYHDLIFITRKWLCLMTCVLHSFYLSFLASPTTSYSLYLCLGIQQIIFLYTLQLIFYTSIYSNAFVLFFAKKIDSLFQVILFGEKQCLTLLLLMWYLVCYSIIKFSDSGSVSHLYQIFMP
jgi:hypothetical protein